METAPYAHPQVDPGPHPAAPPLELRPVGPQSLEPWCADPWPAPPEMVEPAEWEVAEHPADPGLEVVEPAVQPWRPSGPLGLKEAVERLVLLERFRALLDAEAVGLRVRVLTAYRDRQAEGIRELAECTRARGQDTAARQMIARAAHLAGADLEAAHSLAATEIAAALHVADGTARAQLEEAEELALHHQPVLAALADGTVSWAHARIINDECRTLRLRIPAARPRDTDEQARTREQLETTMLAASRTLETALLGFGTGRTPAQLRDKARRLRETRNPDTARARHEAAAAARDAWVEPSRDGMGRLCVALPALQAQALLDRIRRIAAARAAHPTETRTLSQLRADTLADIGLAGTLGNAWDGIRGHVLVLIPHTVLTGTPDTATPATDGTGTDGAGIDGIGAAELNGYGPIDAASARRLAAGTPTWTRLYAAPDGLAVVGMDHGRYRPTPAQRRALWAGDRTCRFPGCRRNALACEPDHVHEHHHGGPTALGNLASLCRKHHTYKSLGLWRARIGPDRTLEFTSPAGRTYHTNPPMPWHTHPPDPPDPPEPPMRQHEAPTKHHGPPAPHHEPSTPRREPGAVRCRTGWDSPGTDDDNTEIPPF